MRNLYGVLSILLLACVAGNSAYGALASKGYVDQWKFDVLQGTENANKAVITAPVTGKVTLGQIKTAMIENSAVTNLKLATDSVASENIINGDVKTDDIADGAITRAKLADDAKYVLPVATDTTLGGVKSGGDIRVSQEAGANLGKVTVIRAQSADEADRAKRDHAENIIVDTYVRKDYVGNMDDFVPLNNIKGDTLSERVNVIAVAADDANQVAGEALAMARHLDETFNSMTIPVATEEVLGGVLSGNDIEITPKGNVFVRWSDEADMAKKDNEGNTIVDTYARKDYVGNIDDFELLRNIGGNTLSESVNNVATIADGASTLASDIAAAVVEMDETDGKLKMKPATYDEIGGVKSGDFIDVSDDGYVKVLYASETGWAKQAENANYSKYAEYYKDGATQDDLMRLFAWMRSNNAGQSNEESVAETLNTIVKYLGHVDEMNVLLNHVQGDSVVAKLDNVADHALNAEYKVGLLEAAVANSKPGQYLTDIDTQSGFKFVNDYVKIPIGNPTATTQPTSAAYIWVE